MVENPPSHDLTDTRPAWPPRPAPWEWAILSLLIVGCLLSWARYYASFEMHNPDFFGMKEMAKAIYGLHLPGTLKRMPGYPSVLGLVAMVMPGDEPFNHAAMVIGFICSAVSLVLLFFIGRRFVGRAGLIAVIGLAATPVFSLMVTQTMLEAFMGMLIFATILLSMRGSQWAYATAAWASICRQECVVLVPLVWAMNLTDRPGDWLMHTLKAFVAGLPFVAWQLFARWAGKQIGGQDAYTQEMAGMGWVLEWRKIWLMLGPYPEADAIFQWPLLLLAFIGVAVGLWRLPRPTLMILGFFLFYNAVHVVFPVYRLRYAYPVLFVVPLLATVGGHWIVVWLGQITADRRMLRVGGAVLVALLGVAWSINRWLDFGRPRLMEWQHGEDFLGLAILIFVLLAATVVLAMRRQSAVLRIAVAVGLVAFATGPVLLGAGIRAREQGYYDYENVEFRYAADWIAQHVKPGESIAMPRGYWEIAFEHRLDLSQIYDISTFEAKESDTFFEDLDRIGIDYVLMLKTTRMPTDPDEINYNRNRHWYYDMRANLTEPLRGGTEIDGFELIDTVVHQRSAVVPIEPVYVFRFLRDELPDEGDDPSRVDHNPLASPVKASP